jgi:hypothetical protein
MSGFTPIIKHYAAFMELKPNMVLVPEKIPLAMPEMI